MRRVWKWVEVRGREKRNGRGGWVKVERLGLDLRFRCRGLGFLEVLWIRGLGMRYRFVVGLWSRRRDDYVGRHRIRLRRFRWSLGSGIEGR